MQKRFLAVSVCVLAVTLAAFAQNKSAGGAPDKAYMQKIWDGWAQLDTSKVAPFYAKGQHVFFDIAPLKYNSWDEYQAGVTKELGDYKSAAFQVNDDVQTHPAGEYVWATSTVKFDMVHKSDKHDMGNFRWTVVFGKQEGKWVIVHEHVSVPME